MTHQSNFLQVPNNPSNGDQSEIINLTDACNKGVSSTRIRQFLRNQKPNESPPFYDRYNRSALHYAAQRGRLSVVNVLLENGFDANQSDQRGLYPIDLAIQSKHYDVAIQLCKLTDSTHVSAIQSDKVCRNYQPHQALLLLSQNPYHPQMLTLCSELMAANFDINTLDGRKCNALFYAMDKPLLVRMLIEFGIDLHHQDTFGRNALFFAVHSGHTESVEILIQSGLDIDSQNKLQHTPLMLACVFGNVNIVDTLLRNGASVNAVMTPSSRKQLAMGPLSMALRHEKYEIAMLLIKNGAVMDREIGHGLMVWDLIMDVGFSNISSNNSNAKSSDMEMEVDDGEDIRELYHQPRRRRNTVHVQFDWVQRYDTHSQMEMELYTFGNVPSGYSDQKREQKARKDACVRFMIQEEMLRKMQGLENSKLVQSLKVPQDILQIIASPLVWY